MYAQYIIAATEPAAGAACGMHRLKAETRKKKNCVMPTIHRLALIIAGCNARGRGKAFALVVQVFFSARALAS